MSNEKVSKSEQKKLDREKQIAAKLYSERLKVLKKGQEFSVAGDIAKSVQYYSQYLNVVANYHKIDEKKLTPALFDKEKEISELFLISHVYWDLAKAFDRTPKLNHECVRCLNQYVKFTVGFRYQYVNARTLKNFMRKRLAHNPAAFKEAYEKIQVESKGCFISSTYFGDNSLTTNRLRTFKDILISIPLGYSVVDVYYNSVCPFFFRLNNTLLFQKSISPILKSLLFVFSLFFKPKRF